MSIGHDRHGSGGPVRGTGPLAGSYNGVDHHRHRQELFGDLRPEEASSSTVCSNCGEPFGSPHARAGHEASCKQGPPVEPREAVEMYTEYWTTEASQSEIAKAYGHNQRVTRRVVYREMHAEATEKASRRLGHPEEREWASGETRKVEA